MILGASDFVIGTFVFGSIAHKSSTLCAGSFGQ